MSFVGILVVVGLKIVDPPTTEATTVSLQNHFSTRAFTQYTRLLERKGSRGVYSLVHCAFKISILTNSNVKRFLYPLNGFLLYNIDQKLYNCAELNQFYSQNYFLSVEIELLGSTSA